MSSIKMVNLMLAVETEFDLTIPQGDITPDNFRSVASVEALVARLTRRQVVAVCRSFGTRGGGERLIEIGDDVIDVLDADAQPDGLRPDARLALLLGRHLPMGRRGGVTGE